VFSIITFVLGKKSRIETMGTLKFILPRPQVARRAAAARMTTRFGH
jgi:hypothetical protein